MPELIHIYTAEMVDEAGKRHEARAMADRRADGTWEAWLEFVPRDGGIALRTDRETTQPDRAAVDYWAGGIERIYLEGALHRARRA
jgi:hypothetical protein